MWNHHKTLFSHWGLCCLKRLVMWLILRQISVFIPVCAAKDVTLYNLHITALQRWQKVCRHTRRFRPEIERSSVIWTCQIFWSCQKNNVRTVLFSQLHSSELLLCFTLDLKCFSVNEKLWMRSFLNGKLFSIDVVLWSSRLLLSLLINLTCWIKVLIIFEKSQWRQTLAHSFRTDGSDETLISACV